MMAKNHGASPAPDEDEDLDKVGALGFHQALLPGT